MDSERFNPVSTSGIGFRLEHYIQASYIAALIVENPLPYHSNLTVREVSLQAKNIANTDDAIVKLSNGTKNETHFIQSKKGFTIGETPTFYDVVIKAFSDFKKKTFNQSNDKFIIVSDCLSKSDVNDGLTMLAWARFSNTADNFKSKIELNKKKKAKYDQFFRALLKSDKSVSHEMAWSFLKCIFIKEYDYLANDQSKDLQSLIWYLKPYVANGISPSHALREIANYIEECNQHGATIDSTNVSQSIRELFNATASPKIKPELLGLLKKSKSQLETTIFNDIEGFHLERTEYIDKISDSIESSRFVAITGDAGFGKSALAKDYILQSFNGNVGFIYLKADQLDRSSLAHTLSDLGISIDFETLLSQWINLPKLIIYIDSFEKLYESDNKESFLELLGQTGRYNNVTILVTCRAYAFETLQVKYRIAKVNISTVAVSPLTAKELVNISEAKPTLKGLIKNLKLNNIISVPFYLSQAIRFIDGISDGETIDETSFKNALWEQVIEKKGDSKSGVGIKRAKVFTGIVLDRALKKKAFVQIPKGADSSIIAQLESDNLLIKQPGQDSYAPTHDIFEDIVIVKHIQSLYESKKNETLFIESIDTNPVFRRGVRLWIQDIIINDPKDAEIFLRTIKPDYISSPIVDEILIGILGSENCYTFLNVIRDILLENNCQLLFKVCFLCQVAYSVPFKSQYPQIHEKTFGPGWNSLLKILNENYDDHKKSISKMINNFLYQWSLQFEYDETSPAEGAIAAKFCLDILNNDVSWRFEKKKPILEVLFKVAIYAQTEVKHLITNSFERRKSDSEENVVFDRELCKMLLIEPFRCVKIYELLPATIIDLARLEWLSSKSPEYYDSDYRESSAGLNGSPYDYFSASANQTPFKYLFRYHSNSALKFLIELCNYSVLHYLKSEYVKERKVALIEFEFDGDAIRQWGDGDLWGAYRGIGNRPYLLQSALMSFEEFLLQEAANGKILEQYFDPVIKTSNSVLLTSVLSSVAMAYPYIFGKKIYTILKVKPFIQMDLSRYAGELSIHHTTIGNHPYYINERHESNRLKHRKTSLENLVSILQLYSPDEINNILDQHIAESANEDTLWRLALARMDLRGAEQEVIEEKSIVVFHQKPLPEDLRKHVEEYSVEEQKQRTPMSISLWADKVLKGEITTTEDEWRENKSQIKEVGKDSIFTIANPQIQLAIIALDGLLDKISSIEIRDCATLILEEAKASLNQLKKGNYHGVLNITGNVTLQFLPNLFNEKIASTVNKPDLEKVVLDLLILLPEEYRKSLIIGIREKLWTLDSRFSDQCFQVLLRLSSTEKLNMAFRLKHLKEEFEFVAELNDIIAEIITGRRIEFNEVELKNDLHIEIADALALLPYNELDTTYSNYLEEILTQLKGIPNLNDHQNYLFLERFKKILGQYLYNSSSQQAKKILVTLLYMTDEHFEFVADTLKWIIAFTHDDNYPERLWGHFKTIKSFTYSVAPIVGLFCVLLFDSLKLYDENGNRMIYNKLPGNGEGQKIHQELISTLGNDNKLIRPIIQLLSGIGSSYQPICLTWLMKSLPSKAELDDLQLNPLSTKAFEDFVRQIYENHLNYLRKNGQVMDYFILLLNMLVDNGSTYAFRLRDEII